MIEATLLPFDPSSVRRVKSAATAWVLSKRTLDPGFLDDGSPTLDFRSHLRAKFSRRLILRLDTLKEQPVARVGGVHGLAHQGANARHKLGPSCSGSEKAEPRYVFVTRQPRLGNRRHVG